MAHLPHLSQPPALDLTGNLAENWKRFKQRYTLYNIASELTEKDDKTQTSTLLHIIGEAALDIYNTFIFESEDDSMKQDVVLKKFEEYCMPKRNITFERHRFFTRDQQPGETIDQYATELRTRSKSCEFGELKDSLIRDRIICGIPEDSLRERLLRGDNLTLEKVMQLCRAAETTKLQAKELAPSGKPVVDAVRAKDRRSNGKGNFSKKSPHASNKGNKTCYRCAQTHEYGACPAHGKTCTKCGKINHFAKACKGAQSSPYRQKNVHNVTETPEDMEEFFVDVIDGDSGNDEWKLQLHTHGIKVNYKLDTGAQANLLPEKLFQQMKPQPKLHAAKVKATGYSGVDIPITGKCMVKVQHKSKNYFIAFLVTPGNHQPLLGLQACEKMNLIKRVLNITKTPLEVEDFADVFTGLGCLPGTHHITTSEDAIPVQHACRKVPFPLQGKLKEELDKMEQMQVITKIDQPTDWVSSLCVVDKKNGKLRVCLDPRDLNRAIKRQHYKLPSRAEITAHFAGAKFFSKLDASSGFWQIKLDDASSELCTFITPFGRYRFLRLPFGISSAPEVYHKIIHDLFSEVPGVNTMMDDIIVWGSTREEHDQNLRQVLEIAERNNLKLNREKCEFGVRKLTFIGDVISDQGVLPDPKKVSAILNMQKPQNKNDVQRFMGMINYMGKFIPDLSTKSAPLRSLLDQKNQWMWLEAQEKAWQELKVILTTAPVLRFYDPKKPIKLSADASKNGLGAVLLQQYDNEWAPVAYASRAMTAAETRYAQIEKELLAITYACERFHQYIYGQQIEVETDHKPLIPLFTKPLCDCPLRVQRMLIRVQRYDLKVSYTPGKYMYTADTLSRAVDPHADKDSSKEDDIQAYVNTILTNMPVSSNRKKEIALETKRDETLKTLSTIINEGWPDVKSKCPVAISDYWNARDELSQADDMLFKGTKIIIPTSMRRNMLEKIHEGHLGIEKCKRRAREVMYWPRINQDVADMVKNCNSCQTYQPKQTAETLQPHPTPDRPWQKVGADLFTLNSKNYIVIVDYFSQFVEICTLTSTTSGTVINNLKSVFSRQGTPHEMFTDNGPQFSSAEFKRFSADWDFTHTTSSPHYPQSNGLVENAVKIVKNMIRKTVNSGQDIYRALQIYRSTPLECGKSPAELLYNRRIRSNLPMVDSLLGFKHLDSKAFKQRKDAQKEKQKGGSRDLPLLQVGDTVRLLDTTKNMWSQGGVVTAALPNRSYQVDTGNGTRRRNRRHLRVASQPPQQCDFIEPSSKEQDFETTMTATAVEPNNNDITQPTATMTRSGRVVKPPIRLDL